MTRLVVLAAVVAVLVPCALAHPALASSGLPVARPPVFLPTEQPQFMLDQILVKFAPGASATAVGTLDKSLGATRHKVGRNLDFEVVSFPLVQSTAVAKAAYARGDEATCLKMLADAEDHVYQVIDAYKQSGLVEWVRPNCLVSCLMTPNDPYYVWPTSWPNSSTPDQYGVIQMNPAIGWDASTGEGALIVETDTGLDLDHPDIAANVWTNPGEIAGNGIDDDHNGYVDDVHGYDFCGSWAGDPWGSPNEDSNPDVFAGDPACGDGTDNNFDGYADAGVGHGTMTSGCAACVVNNSTGFAGVAGHAKIAMARCLSPEGSGTEAMIAAAFEYARAIPADVINCSLGGTTAMPTIETQMQADINAGIAIFCASGNDGTNHAVYPAAYPECLAVGGVKHDDSGKTSITSYGNWLDCCAASGDVDASGTSITEAIWTIYVASVADANSTPGVVAGQAMIAGAAGTSFASPYAAGVGALIKSLEPSFTPTQVYNQITSHCYDIPPAGYDIQTGYGRIDISAALNDWNLSAIPPTRVTGAGVASFPNPATGGAAIRLSGAGVRGAQRIEVLDIEGRLLRDIAVSGGEASWDGATNLGVDAGSGVFFYRAVSRDGKVVGAGKLVRIR